MIRNNHDLDQTREAIIHLENAVFFLKRDILPINSRRFAIMAEPAIDQIQELRAQIEVYIGITSAMMQEAETDRTL